MQRNLHPGRQLGRGRQYHRSHQPRRSGTDSFPGGVPTTHTPNIAPGEVTHRWPQVLPGGRAVLFSAYTADAGHRCGPH